MTASLPGSLHPHRPTSTGRAGQRTRIDEPNCTPNRFRRSSMPAVAGCVRHVVRLLPIAGSRHGRIEADLHRQGLQHVVETAQRVAFVNRRLGHQQQRPAAADVVPNALERILRPRLIGMDQQQDVGLGEVLFREVLRLDELAAQALDKRRQHSVAAGDRGIVLRLEPIEIAFFVGDESSCPSGRIC